MSEVNEATTVTLNLVFKDENGVLITPTSGQYRINDKESRTILKVETSFVPSSSSYDLVILASENLIINNDKKDEIRIVTIDFWYLSSGISRKGGDIYEYDLKNLRFKKKASLTSTYGIDLILQ